MVLAHLDPPRTQSLSNCVNLGPMRNIYHDLGLALVKDRGKEGGMVEFGRNLGESSSHCLLSEDPGMRLP